MKRTVLLVDDEVRVLEGLRRALRRENLHLISAGSGREALDLLEQHPVDAIVTDEVMPGMSGTRLLAEARQRWPDVARVVLTGHREFDTAMRAINLGEVDRFFLKPCNTPELGAALRELTEDRALRRQARRLLSTVRRQSTVLETLEDMTPGITAITRDETGSIVLEDEAVDMQRLLIEIDDELERAEGRTR